MTAPALAAIRDRIEQLLLDTANAIFTTTLLDEATQITLDEYNHASPQNLEAVITLPADGREIALNTLTDLIHVTEVWWPYDSDASEETWPPNRVAGFSVYRDNAQPVLFLTTTDASQPQQNDEARIWYTAPHTIQDLASASTTTLPPEHISHLVRGAAAHALLARSLDLAEDTTLNTSSTPNYAVLSSNLYRAWTKFLATLAPSHHTPARPYGAGWRIDKWDR